MSFCYYFLLSVGAPQVFGTYAFKIRLYPQRNYIPVELTALDGQILILSKCMEVTISRPDPWNCLMPKI